MTYRADPKFRLLDKDGEQLCICSFVEQYENSLRLGRFIKMSQDATFSKIFGVGIREIATMSQHQHNKKSNLAQFDEKDNNNTNDPACASEDSIQHISNTSALTPERDNNFPPQQICTDENSSTHKSEQYVVEKLRNSNNNNHHDSSPLQDYVAFDLEWTNNNDDNGIGSRTIYAAAFVDNHGNQKVLHISDFAGSETQLLQAIIDEILKYSASIGWYTTGVAKGKISNHKGIGGVCAAA